MEGTVAGRDGGRAMVRLAPETLEELGSGAGPVVLYKHSSSCGISLWTRRHVEAFAEQRADVEVYWLDVLEQRPLSMEVARRFGIPHASPQAIVVRKGAAVWDASHMGVTADALERAVGNRPR